ncbi:MAG: hypothetical protein KDD70_01590 [Bdellovibrionales bacterium]|nr:hypothetical protein [Bdellovibrionales bacterium]
MRDDRNSATRRNDALPEFYSSKVGAETDFYIDLEREFPAVPPSAIDKGELGALRAPKDPLISPSERKIKLLQDDQVFATNFSVEDLQQVLLHASELEVHHLDAVLSLARHARMEGVRDNFAEPKIIVCRQPEKERDVAAQVYALNSGEAGFLRGPEIQPHRLVALHGDVGLEEIVTAFRILGMEVVATNTPTRSGALPVQWQLFYRPEAERNAA